MIEIKEDDCNTKTCLETTIISDDHINTLINKWYKSDEKEIDWVLLKEKDQVKVGQKIFVRSPIFCRTPDMKICKKCWGEKKLETKYIGILAGQILAERFTQLSLRLNRAPYTSNCI